MEHSLTATPDRMHMGWPMIVRINNHRAPSNRTPQVFSNFKPLGFWAELVGGTMLRLIESVVSSRLSPRRFRRHNMASESRQIHFGY
jgi:hypothetical protein